MKDYQSLLKTAWDELPEPKRLPEGTWLLRVNSAKFLPPKNEDDVLKAQIVEIPVQAADDVDAVALEELGDDYDFENNAIFHTIWLRTARDWKNLFNIIEMHGVTIEPSDTPEQTLPKIIGEEVLGYVATRSYENRDGQLVEEDAIRMFQPADE